MDSGRTGQWGNEGTTVDGCKEEENKSDQVGKGEAEGRGKREEGGGKR